MTSEINTNSDTDPYDDEEELGRATAVPVKIIGKPSVSLAPEFGALLTTTIQQYGIQQPTQLLQRRKTRHRARLYLNTNSVSSTPSTAYGSAAAPAANTNFVALTGLPIGLYSVQWTFNLEGTPSATDADNVQIHVTGGGATQRGVNPPVDGLYPQATAILAITAAGQNIDMQNIAAGTAGTTYSGTIIATPLANNPTVYMNSRPDGLTVAPLPIGGLIPAQQWLIWENQEPLYAICVGGTATALVLDETYLENKGFPT